MKEKLEQIRREALAALSETKTAQDLDALRVKYLGKKGALTAVLKQMGGLSAEERPIIGQLANEVREALTTALEQEQKRIEKAALDARLELEQVDVTIPGKPVELGHRHPMYIALDEIKDIFVGMGFQVLDGPEVELAEYNFDKLNAPEGHPSRDWSDTFYFDQDSRVMLRSQTSPMQVRAMETMPLPIRIIAPGRVYRKDEVDATHSPMFHQVEGMVIDKGVTMADLKGTLNTVMEQLYGGGTGPPARWTCSATSAAAPAAPPARARAGSKCWAPAWSIPECWRWPVSIPRSTAAGPSAWVWSGWPCGSSRSPTCGSSSKMMCASWSNSEIPRPARRTYIRSALRLWTISKEF